MFGVIALLSPLALAGSPVESVVIMAQPVPVGLTGSSLFGASRSVAGGTLAVCRVDWTVPLAGEYEVTLDPSCPLAWGGAVSAAARQWVFAAPVAAVGSDALVVTRWFTLASTIGGGTAWTARVRDPRVPTVSGEGCVEVVQTVDPRMPASLDPSMVEQCEALSWLDEGGRPVHVEVQQCATAASLNVLAAVTHFKYRVCEGMPADERMDRLKVTFKR